MNNIKISNLPENTNPSLSGVTVLTEGDVATKVSLETLKNNIFTGGTSSTPSYKVYSALLGQSGTSDPSVIVLENTLGTNINWTYNALGEYVGYSPTSTFTLDKTICFITCPSRLQLILTMTAQNDVAIIDVYSFGEFSILDADNPGFLSRTNINSFDKSGNILHETSIEIRVYN